jgi:predicted transposase/invertase (TIGR01784 family)
MTKLEELEAYDALGIFIQDQRGRIEYALEEGMKIGEEKGIKKGKIETAKELLKMGIEIEKITSLTLFIYFSHLQIFPASLFW